MSSQNYTFSKTTIREIKAFVEETSKQQREFNTKILALKNPPKIYISRGNISQKDSLKNEKEWETV